MIDVIAESAKKTSISKDKDSDRRLESTALDRRYGQIGISAVVAAVRYQGVGKNPAYAPCSNEWRSSLAEAAA